MVARGDFERPQIQRWRLSVGGIPDAAVLTIYWLNLAAVEHKRVYYLTVQSEQSEMDSSKLHPLRTHQAVGTTGKSVAPCMSSCPMVSSNASYPAPRYIRRKFCV